MFSLRSTIGLLLLLFIPFVLRKLNIEPYPAVLLPEGASIVNTANNLTSFTYQEVYGLKNKKDWQRVDVVMLMQPIPIQYFPTILERNFSDIASKSRRRKWLKMFHLPDHLNKQHDADAWFMERLGKQSLDPGTLRIVTFAKVINIQTGQESSRISDEKIIHLSN